MHCGSIIVADAKRATPEPPWRRGECVSLPPLQDTALALSVFTEGCAMIPAASYDPETLWLLTRAFDEAWSDL